jgi:hypothetical protein
VSDLARAKAATLVPTGDEHNKVVVQAGEVIDFDALGTPQWFRDAVDEDPWTMSVLERVKAQRPRAAGRKKEPEGQPEGDPAGPTGAGGDDLAAAAAKLAQGK